jgi:methylenetetrahydrofolate dehydrogenase (NADP+) / methenyltetrahydrofolate cyclohydrolase
MTANILSSKRLYDSLKSQIKLKIAHLAPPPCLLVILIGHHPASLIYVNHKKNACKDVGIECLIENYPEELSETELLMIIQKHNQNPNIHGILIQFPLPEHIRPESVIECIHPLKDVDGFHPYNLGRLAAGFPNLRPCTPYGIIQLLQYYQIELKGIDALVIGASRIVGRPMTLELLLAKASVTVCHSQTLNLSKKIQDNQLIIVATGKRNLVNTDDLHSKHIIIDVGIHRDEQGKICGDINFDSAKNKCLAITPVPGGVGPMTIMSLLQNVLQAYRHLRQ